MVVVVVVAVVVAVVVMMRYCTNPAVELHMPVLPLELFKVCGLIGFTGQTTSRHHCSHGNRGHSRQGAGAPAIDGEVHGGVENDGLFITTTTPCDDDNDYYILKDDKEASGSPFL